MKLLFGSFLSILILAGIHAAAGASSSVAIQAAGAQADSPTSRLVGTVESVTGNSVVLKTDAGTSVTVTVAEGAKVLRSVPGQSLKEAATIPLQEVQVGDRMLARGGQGADATTATASMVIVMKHADVATRQQQDLREWQRGVGGIVASVGPAGDIQARSTPAQTVVVHTSAKTSFLRYSPNSVQFKDAVKSSIDQVKPGDQMRARGTRSSDGLEMTADEVIAGHFLNIAGTISSLDSEQKLLTVQDLATKKPIEVKIASDSQMHQLPAQMATRLGMMLKAGSGNSPVQRSASTSEPASGVVSTQGGPRTNAPDIQQMLNRTPSISLSDLKKGDAVMIVATPGGTAVTLIGGVEPILTAAPNGSGAATLLSNWNISAPDAGSGGPQ